MAKVTIRLDAIIIDKKSEDKRNADFMLTKCKIKTNVCQ